MASTAASTTRLGVSGGMSGRNPAAGTVGGASLPSSRGGVVAVASAPTATIGGGGTAGGGGDFGSLLASSSSILSSIGRMQPQQRGRYGTVGDSYSIAGGVGGSELGAGAPPALKKNLRELSVASASLGVPNQQRSGIPFGGQTSEMSGYGTSVGGGLSGQDTITGTTTTGIDRSSTTVGGGGGAGTYAAEASAHRLLAREGGGFDSARLGRSARELEIHASSAGASSSSARTGGAGMALRSGEYPQTPFGVRSGLLRRGRGVATPGGGDMPAVGGTGGGGAALASGAVIGGGVAASRALRVPYFVPHGDARDVDSYLRHHQDFLIQSSLLQERASAERNANKLVEDHMAEDFAKERDSMLRQLGGYRTLGSGPPAVESHGGLTMATVKGTDGGMMAFRPTAAPTPYAARRAAAAAAATSDRPAAAAAGQQRGDPFSPLQPRPLDPSYGTPSTTRAGGPSSSTLPEGPSRHAFLVERINATTNPNRHKSVVSTSSPPSSYSPGGTVTAYSTADETFADFRALAESLHRRQSSSVDDNTTAGAAYVNAWSLLRSMLSRPNTTTSNTHSSDPVRDNAIGTLAHLCRHYRDHVTNRVRAAALGGRASGGGVASGGQTTDVGGFGLDVSTYVRLEHGTGLTAGDNIWSQVYYCLRCGDATAAYQALQTATSRGCTEDIEQPILHLLSLLSQFQSNQGAQSLFETGMLPTIHSKDREAISDLYHRSQTRSNEVAAGAVRGGESVYKVATLALLGLAEPLTSSSASGAVVRTIEDYLFATLWMAVHRPSPQTCSDEVTNLGKLIKHWGPSYFEGDDYDASGGRTKSTGGGVSGASPSGGWSYAFPLLASQQFGTALVHLANAGAVGLLQATHLGIVMDFAGTSLDDWDGDETTATTTTMTTDQGGGGGQLLTSLLVSYSANLQNVDPKVALEYLVRVPDVGHRPGQVERIGTVARKQVCRLLLESRAFALLAGTVSPDGSRLGSKSSSSPEHQPPGQGGGGALDAHFSATEVSSILADAAGEAMRVGNAGDAADLLALAGRYGSLLSLLNRELASLLVVEEGKVEQRKFWREAALRFHTHHLSNGRTHVVEVLEAEGNLALGNTFQLLMNLMVFFDRCRDQQWEDAWKLVDSLHLLPQSESDMSRKVETFHSLDTVVKQSFHHVVLGAMESLYRQHGNLKSRNNIGTSTSQGGQDGAAAAASAVEQRLKELRMAGRLLVTFSGLIHLSHGGDTNSRIARMEAYMM